MWLAASILVIKHFRRCYGAHPACCSYL